jgi:hypothetical protein
MLTVVMNSMGNVINEAIQFGMGLGLVIGVCGISAVALIYMGYRRASLKRYILQADENTRGEVMNNIRYLEEKAEFLAVKTNTPYFKSLANEFHLLVAFIKKRNLG